MDLIISTKNGLYCPLAQVYIDPYGKVDKAIITHGHADHARPNHGAYLCAATARPVIQFRLTSRAQIQTLEYGQPLNINGVGFSFHPAGHILGSAQVRIAYKGEIWVVSGDYKTEDDGFSEPFEPVKCHTFITESTFALPIFDWQPQHLIFDEMNNWWKENQKNGITSVVCAYSLGKAQRIIQNLDHKIGKIYCNQAIENTNQVIRNQGVDLKPTIALKADISRGELEGQLVMITPNSMGTAAIRKLRPFATASSSGWMMLQKRNFGGGVDKGFVLSDHADWKGLLWAVKQSEAEQILVTHGYTDAFAKYLNENGYNAKTIDTHFEQAKKASKTEKMI